MRAAIHDNDRQQEQLLAKAKAGYQQQFQLEREQIELEASKQIEASRRETELVKRARFVSGANLYREQVLNEMKDLEADKEAAVERCNAEVLRTYAVQKKFFALEKKYLALLKSETSAKEDLDTSRKTLAMAFKQLSVSNRKNEKLEELLTKKDPSRPEIDRLKAKMADIAKRRDDALQKAVDKSKQAEGEKSTLLAKVLVADKARRAAEERARSTESNAELTEVMLIAELNEVKEKLEDAHREMRRLSERKDWAYAEYTKLVNPYDKARADNAAKDKELAEVRANCERVGKELRAEMEKTREESSEPKKKLGAQGTSPAPAVYAFASSFTFRCSPPAQEFLPTPANVPAAAPAPQTPQPTPASSSAPETTLRLLPQDLTAPAVQPELATTSVLDQGGDAPAQSETGTQSLTALGPSPSFPELAPNASQADAETMSPPLLGETHQLAAEDAENAEGDTDADGDDISSIGSELSELTRAAWKLTNTDANMNSDANGNDSSAA